MAKRVNTGFLIGLTVVIGGVAVGGFALFYLSHHSSKYYLDHSLQAEAKGDIPVAAGYMAPAIFKDPSNKSLYIRQGDLYARLVSQDPRYLGNSETSYHRVLELDPGYRDAINRLLTNDIGRVRSGANSPAVFKELKDIADKGVASDSGNPHYATWSAIAVVQPWLMTMSQTSPAIDRISKSLADIAKQHPEEAEAAFYASLVQLRRAQEYRATREDDKAKALLDEVAQRHQAATKARPQDADVQLRASQVFAQIASLDPDRKADITEQSRAAVTAARANAKPDDELFDEICHWQIFSMTQAKASRDEIEKVYTAWSAARPHDARVRLEYAQFLGSDPAQRGQAMTLLSAPITPDASVTGFAALQAKGNERAILVALNSLRADEAFTAQTARRTELLTAIDQDLTRIQDMGLGEDEPLLKLRGKSQMLHNQPIEAVKSFDRAQAMIGANAVDLDLWNQRQRAYLITGQTGVAMRMMEDLLTRMPGNSDLRAHLARLYLDNRQTEKAAEQIKALDANPPKDPATISLVDSMKVLLLQQQADVPGAINLIATRPEQTRDQRLQKAQLAVDVAENEEAVRLYRLVLHDDPADPQAGSGIVSLLLGENNKAEALQVAEDALKAKPDSIRWKSLRDQLAANTPAKRLAVQEYLINQVSDPLMRELQLAELFMTHGDMDGAAKHYAAAEKIDPKAPRVLIARIGYLMRLGKNDDAARAVDDAATANADRMNGLSLRTRFALERKDRDSALKYGNQLISQYPEFAVNWLLYGQAQQAAGQLREAVTSMDQALQRQPNLVEAFRIKAVCLEALGQYGDEKDAIAAARRLAPENKTLRDLDLNWELHHGDADKVVATCQDLLKKEPSAAVYAAFAQASRVAADAKYRGDPAAYKQMLEKARAALDDGFKQFGQTPDVLRLYGPQAIVLDGLGDTAGAENVLKQYAARPEVAASSDPNQELAKFYETHNRIPEAEAQWNEVYKKSGQSVEAELALAQFYARHGKIDDALKVLEANPSDRRVQRQRIESLLAMRRFAEAKTALANAYGSNPIDPAALYFRGIIELNSGDSNGGVNDLTTSRDRDPDNVMTRIWLARALLARGQRDDAVVQLEYALQRAPLRDDVRILLLEAYQSPQPRWADFDRVVLDAEQNPILNLNPQWYQIYAHALAQRGQFDGAKQQILAAQKLAPNSTDLQDEYVNILVQSKDWQNVLAQTDQQLAAGRKDGMIYGRRGVARAGLGDKTGALREFDTAIAIYKAAGNPNGIADALVAVNNTVAPDEALARINLLPAGPPRDMLTAQIYGDKGDFAHEAQTADGVLTKYPNVSDAMKADVYSTEATAYLSMSQWDKAHQAYDNLLKYRPNDLVVLNNVAYLLADKMNAPLDAKSYSKRAYDTAQAQGGVPGITDTHGWILTLCGGRDAQQGLEILQNLVDSNQNLTKSRYHLAVAYQRAGNMTAADEQLKIVQSQIDQLQKNHQPVDAELLDGVKKMAEQVRQKTGVP